MRKANEVEQPPDLLDEYDFSKLKGSRGKYAGCSVSHNFTIEVRQEGERWFAKIPAFGVEIYGGSREEAISKVQGLAFRVLADRIEQGKSLIGPATISFSLAE